MSNRLEELQAKCKRYHLKQSMKIAGIIFFIAVAAGGIFFLGSSVSFESDQSDMARTEVIPQETLNYTLDVSSDDVAKAVAKMQADKSASKPKPVQAPQSVNKKSEQQSKEPVFIKATPKQTLFTNISEEKPLESWIEKYNQKKSYALAIYIAKQYYFDSEYGNASIWAKRANQLDRNKEEAWLYYAQSLYALGEREKAKRILNILLQYKESTKAELLLSEWSQRRE